MDRLPAGTGGGEWDGGRKGGRNGGVRDAGDLVGERKCRLRPRLWEGAPGLWRERLQPFWEAVVAQRPGCPL